ncbi:MAG: hypothetical protein ACX939_15045, partial [Hyphococcus sp.]
GEISTYGRMAAQFVPADSASSAMMLGFRDNLAGYLDARKRDVEIPLAFESLGAGQLTLRYEGAGEFEGRVFDERVFDVAPAQ